MDIENYVPVQSFDLASDTKITFDLFVHLPLNQKYILFRRKGDLLEADRLEDLQRHQNFFVREAEYTEFVKYVAERIHFLISDKKQSNPVMVAKAASRLLKSTFSHEDSATIQVMMTNLTEITSTIIESVAETTSLGSKKAFRKIAEMATTGSSSHKHPVNVASLAVLVTIGIGYISSKTLTEVAIGGLLHDIGFSRMSARIGQYANEPYALDISEREQLYRHPIVALEILKDKKVPLSPNVVNIVLQHHEQYNGNGYPQALRGYQISEFAQILHFCDVLEERIINSAQGSDQLKSRLHEMFEELIFEKVLDPFLLSRIRKVIL